MFRIKILSNIISATVKDCLTCNIAQNRTCTDQLISKNYSKINWAYSQNRRSMSNVYRLIDYEQNGVSVIDMKDSVRPIQVNGISNINNGSANGHKMEKEVELAVNCLRSGGVIALPTDTIYGICCLAQNSDAVNRIYDIKGRNLEKPLAISVADIPDVFKWGNVTIPQLLLKKLLPGPVTTVFERSHKLNPALNPGTRLVGIRVPDSGFVREVCRACGEPVALTSANISNQQSSLTIQEFETMWPLLDAVFDGGRIDSCSKSGSTVVDLSKPGHYRIIRPGVGLEGTIETLKSYGLSEDQWII